MFSNIQIVDGVTENLTKQKPAENPLVLKGKRYWAQRKVQLKATLLLLCLLLVVLFSLNAQAVQKTYSFGIVPQQSATRLVEQWGPLLDAVSLASGYPLTFKTAPSIPEFEQRLANGDYDFAYMNPYHYQVFSANPGYQALAKSKDKTLQGILVVRADSEIQNIAQLSGDTLAFPAPQAFAASVVIRGYLAQQQLDFKSKYVGSHDSVYRAVAAGLYPAGGGIPRTFASIDPEILKQLRILWTSAGFTPHAIAVHPRVAPAVSSAVQQALIGLAEQPDDQLLLAELNIDGFVSAKDQDWDDVRQLNIGTPITK
ncbi:phosphate/phosphite/phosphonate ABC transporter substrate-binding protein [Agarivorans sp. Z349TD_8]|uniref:phosphate/phosphite/phosphonate ABC transporter substrate-binding protein n=1 Tax=Agarivorans sp. Z349TD_8 TaxID=3421434 RepID=UPI003D7E874A